MTADRKIVLIADRDVASRRLLEAALKREGLDVVSVAGLGEATASARSRRPTLIIADQVLADGEGASLIAWAKAEKIAAVGTIPAGRDDARPALTSAGAAEVFAKPLRLRDVTPRIVELAATAAAEAPASAASSGEASGELRAGDLLDLLNDIEVEGQTGAMRVTCGDVSGTIYFDGGRIVDATSGRDSGIAALRRIFSWDTGRWEAVYTTTSGRASTIAGPTSSTVADLMDWRDLWDAAAATAGDLATIYRVEYRSLVARLGDLPPEANEFIRTFDGIRTARAALAMGEIEDTAGVRLIGPLVELGVLVRGAQQPAPSVADDFDRLRMTGRMTAIGAGSGAESSAESARRRAEDEARAAADRDARERASEQARTARDEVTRLQEAARLAAEQAALAENEMRRIEVEAEARRAAEEARRIAEEQARIAAAEAARRQAEEEARRRADEETRRRIEAERKQAEADLARVAAEMESLEVARRAEAVDSARRADELRSRENELLAQRNRITGSIQALSLSPGDLSRARDAERAAIAHERGPVAPPAPSGSISPAVVALVASERAALRAEAGGAVHVQPAQPATAAVSAAAPVDEDAFFGASHANHGADHDLFAEPERRGLPAAVWAIIAIFVVGGLVAFAMSRNTPQTRTAPDAGSAAAVVSPDAGPAVAPVEVAGSGEGSGSGDGAVVDAAAALAAATLEAEQKGSRTAADTNYKAEGIAVDATTGAPAAVPVVAAPATTTTTTTTTTSSRPSTSTDSTTSSRPSTSTTTESAPTTREARQAMDACSQAYAAGNYGETITLCEAAVRANPTAASGLVYLGMARFEVGDTQEAVTYLERALRIDGRDSSALLTLGAAKQELGDNEGARAAYERYLQYFPDSRRAEEVRTILQGL